MQQSPVPGGMDNSGSGSGGVVAPGSGTGTSSTVSVGASTPQRRPMPPTTRETPTRSAGSGGLPPVIPSLAATSTGSGGSDFSGCPVPNRITSTPVTKMSSSPLPQVGSEDSSSVGSSGNAAATPAMPDLSSKSTKMPQTLNPKMTGAPASTTTPVPQPVMTPNTALAGPVVKSTVTVEDGVVTRDGVVLGLEALERQQAEMELRRRMQQQQVHGLPSQQQHPSTAAPHNTPHPSVRQPGSYMAPAGGRLDDDDNTEPSSAMASTQSNTIPRPNVVTSGNRESSFSKFIRKRLNSIENFNNNNPSSKNPALDEGDEDEDITSSSGALIYGYLLKRGRNGTWQRRFFETDGECLSYYKNRHRTRLLAQLDLCKVGEIAIDEEDQSGCTFHIQVANRPYSLRAENSGTCKDWVITLNRVKEARMQIGGFELVEPFKAPPDLLDHSEQVKEIVDDDDEFAGATPRVVLRANRQRTRAVVDENVKTWDQLVQVSYGAPPDLISGSPMASRKQVAISGPYSLTEVEQQEEERQRIMAQHLPPQVMARWEKRRSVMYSMGRKIVRWARRVRELRCSADESDVHLDPRVHPPGHDDPKRSPVAVQTTQQSSERAGGDVASVTSAGERSVGSGSAQHYGSDSSSGPQSPTNSFRDAVKYSEWIGKETDISKSKKAVGVPADPIPQPNTVQSNPSGSSQEEEDDEEETRELS